MRRPYRCAALRINHGSANHKRTMKMGPRRSMLKHHRVDEGRFILAQDEPEYEYDLDVEGHNELLLRSQGRKHAAEFRPLADVLHWVGEGIS